MDGSTRSPGLQFRNDRNKEFPRIQPGRSLTRNVLVYHPFVVVQNYDVLDTGEEILSVIRLGLGQCYP